jgi:flagellar basal-body rod protein FlgB
LTPVYLFDLASRHADWAATRQTIVTGNIANANTPGYRARDIEPFEDVLDKTALTMARTSEGHIDLIGGELRSGKVDIADSWDVTHSGNSVSLDQELMKAAEVNKAFSLDASIVRSFHRMLLTAVRSGA